MVSNNYQVRPNASEYYRNDLSNDPYIKEAY